MTATTPAEIIQAALKEGRKTLFEHEAKDLVRSVGIIVPRYVLVDPVDSKAVVTAGENLGFPVVLKAVSTHILHKTDAGAVMLNITTGAGLSASIRTMKNMIAARSPGAVIRSFLIEKMMPQGLELLIGGMRDEQFGPAVAFGLGGVWVEALKDAVFGILPLTHEEMNDMISRTRAGMFLKGFRGSPPLDEEAVHLIIGNLARLLADHPQIKEIDMNPVRIYARGAAALDVRVVLA
jgi:acetate---CoA ligase (ADP-forming) subunit beta